MIFEGEFFSGGHLRWNLGWPSPNYAGAFLVTLLALAFAFSGSRWRWAALVAEAGGLFLLAKTYSRGAVVAWGLAWLFGIVASRGWKVPTERLVWASRAGVLVVMMIAVGFEWSRSTESRDETTQRGAASSAVAKLGRDKSAGPVGETTAGIKQSGEPSVTEDGSVMNRLALWRGGLKMIAVAPLSGWGAGESGRAYMNWFQDLDRDEGYATMVNSYLHVAVEHGLPTLAVVLFGLAWLLAVAWSGARDESASPESRSLQMAAGASLVAWAAANVFTTLWIEPKLWIVPAAACFVLLASVWKTTGIRLVSLTVASLAIAVIAVGGIYGAGRWLLGKQSHAIAPGANGSVILAPAGSAGPLCHVWPDPLVLGSTPGKELRRWLESGPANVLLVVHRAAPLQPGEVSVAAGGVFLFGRQVERLGRDLSPEGRKLWLIHPTTPPPSLGKLPDQPSPMITVVLPQIDEAGNGPAWRKWAEKSGARVVESPESGLDIRAAWPGVLSLVLNQPLARANEGG